MKGEENLSGSQSAPPAKSLMQQVFRTVGTYGTWTLIVVFAFMGALVLYGNLRGYPESCAKACVIRGYDEGKFLISVGKGEFACECGMNTVRIPFPE